MGGHNNRCQRPGFSVRIFVRIFVRISCRIFVRIFLPFFGSKSIYTYIIQHPKSVVQTSGKRYLCSYNLFSDTPMSTLPLHHTRRYTSKSVTHPKTLRKKRKKTKKNEKNRNQPKKKKKKKKKK